MTVAETLLVFVGIPLTVILVIVLLNLRGAHKRPRYKPGQPWEHQPVWYEPHPGLTPAAGDGHGGGHAAIGGRAPAAIGAGSHGEAPKAHPGGPLGGARGTW